MKRYVKATEYWSMDVSTVEDVRDEIDKAILDGTTKEDIEDYLIELESKGNLDRDEFIELRDYAFGAVDRFVESKKSVLSSTSSPDTTDMTEQEIKEFVSTKFLKNIEDYAVQTVLRRVLYYKGNSIDWQDFYQQILEQMPEYAKRGASNTDQPVNSSVSLADVTDEQKQYVYKCVAESPAPPDVDAPEEEWSVFHRDSKEYFNWAFVDAVEDGIFEDDEEDVFTKLWEKASTDMAAPYA